MHVDHVVAQKLFQCEALPAVVAQLRLRVHLREKYNTIKIVFLHGKWITDYLL